MHELGITQEIIEVLTQKVATLHPHYNDMYSDTRVTRVVLEIGKLSSVLPDAIRFYFELCAEGTPVEGAKLQILEPAGRARCKLCSVELMFEQPYGQCQCGSSDLQWLSGMELRILEMEII